MDALGKGITSSIDDIDVAVCSAEISVQFTLGGLPNEILLEIAARLAPTDLSSLALVCRHLRPIAEDVLYTTLDTTQRPNQILSLYRTMTSRPDLAVRTRGLKMRLWPDSTRWRNMPTRTLFPHAPPNSVPTIPVKIQSSIYAGFLLNLLTALEELTLSSTFRDRNGLQSDPLNMMFGNDSGNFDRDRTVLSTLTNLRTLCCKGLHVTWSLCTLPALNRLCILEGSNFSRGINNFSMEELYSPRDADDSRIEDLAIADWSTVLDLETYEFHRMSDFLLGFSQLKRFKLSLQPTHAHATMSYSIVERLSRNFRSTLEILDLTLEKHPLNEHDITDREFLEYTQPFENLTAFKRLKILYVPCGALMSEIASNNADTLLDFPAISVILPSSLEELHIQHPRHREIAGILADLHQHSNRLPNLRLVRLFPYHEIGQSDAIWEKGYRFAVTGEESSFGSPSQGCWFGEDRP